MAMKELSVLVVLALVVRACSVDLSGIHVDGNRFVNRDNQMVVLKVSCGP